MIPLPVLEEIVDRSGAAPRIELLLPAGVRARQLAVRTLLLGMLLVLADHRPAHLTRVHHALISLPEGDQRRLGVVADWKNGPHRLTYRQTERTSGLAAGALAKDVLDGLPAGRLQRVCDDLLEASIPDQFKHASTALAVDWTDVETSARPPRHGTTACADPEASWGHRSSNLPGPKGELFFGYYLSAGTMTRDEQGPPVPELARRMTLASCHLDPVRVFVPVLTRMTAGGIPLGDILADSGCAHRDAAAWAIPLRAAGAQLVQDLHPSDRGPRGTHHGAIIANGRQPPFVDPAHPCPGQALALLAATPQRFEPVPGELVTEGLDCLAVARHAVVGHVPAHHAGQPAALHRNGLMHAPPQLVFNLLQLRPHPLGDRDPLHPELPALRRRADMREPEKVERFRLALAPGCPVAGGEPPELDQPGLVRVQFEPELREPLAQPGHKPLSVTTMLEPDDEVIRPAHHDHITARLPVPPPAGPQVQDVMQVHVSEQRRRRGPLR